MTTNEITLRLADGELTQLIEITKSLAADVTVQAEALSKLAGRVEMLEAAKPRYMHLPAAPVSPEAALIARTVTRTDLRAKRDAVDALIADLALRVGALQWDQPGPDTDERRGFREGAGWALNVARSLRP